MDPSSRSCSFQVRALCCQMRGQEGFPAEGTSVRGSMRARAGWAAHAHVEYSPCESAPPTPPEVDGC